MIHLFMMRMILQARWIRAYSLPPMERPRRSLWGQACRHWRQTRKHRCSWWMPRHATFRRRRHMIRSTARCAGQRKKRSDASIKDRFRAAREYRGRAFRRAGSGWRLTGSISCQPSRIWTASPAAAYTTSAACPLPKSVFGKDPFEPVTHSRVEDILHEQTDTLCAYIPGGGSRGQSRRAGL